MQRRTLQDTVTLNGTLAAPGAAQGHVGLAGPRERGVREGRRAARTPASKLFALDGRDAIAEPGDVRFFRPLGVGDRGDDVLQLKQILAAAGDNPGPMNTVFTEQTRFALAQWQAQHHYPGATPVAPQTVTVSLAQGTGYTLGAQTSAGLDHRSGRWRADDRGATVRGRSARRTRGSSPRSAPTTRCPATRAPVLTIQSTNAVVSEGHAGDVRDHRVARRPRADSTVNLDAGGNRRQQRHRDAAVGRHASGERARSVQVSVPTRVDNVVKPKKTLALGIDGGLGYIGRFAASAQTTITNNNVPALHITRRHDVSPGGSATLTVTADQAPVHDTQVSLHFAGDAVPGYRLPHA